MASKDFIYDLLDKLEEDRTEYLLFTFSREEEEGTGDIYYNFYHEASREDASQILAYLSEAVLKIEDGKDNAEIEINFEDFDNEDDDEDDDEE